MELRLVGPFADLVLRVGASSPERERFVTPEDALALLRPALALSSGHSMAHRDLRTLVSEAGLSPLHLDDEALLQRVARLLVSGTLELERRPHELMLSKFDRYAAYISMRSIVPPYDPLVDEEHWIEVQVETDAEQGLGGALCGVRCEITLPWGLVLRRTTDQFGLVRVDYLPRDGECVIRFPDFEPAKHPDDPSDDWALVATASTD